MLESLPRMKEGEGILMEGVGMAKRMGFSTFVLIAAVACFVLSLFKVALGDLDLITLGLALFAGSFLVRDMA